MEQKPLRKSESSRRADRTIQQRTLWFMVLLGVLVFLALFIKLFDLQVMQHEELEEKALRVYVAKTVRSKAISHGLHEGRTVPFPTAQAADTSDSTDVEQRVMHDESLREALAAIRRLPDKEQLVLRLKLTTDMTNDEIACRVGISPESVRQYLSRARAKVARDVFGKEGTT